MPTTKSRSQHLNIPIIFITAYEDDDAYGLQPGAADYITKPANPAIVITRARNHLALKKQQDLMEAISSTDFMTGVANRRRFDEAIESELRRNTRIHKHLHSSCAMLIILYSIITSTITSPATCV